MYSVVLRYAPFYSFSSHSDSIRFCTPYRVSRRAHRNIRRTTMDICEQYIKHIFLYCCIYSALYSNGNYPIVTESLPSNGCTYHHRTVTDLINALPGNSSNHEYRQQWRGNFFLYGPRQATVRSYRKYVTMQRSAKDASTTMVDDVFLGGTREGDIFKLKGATSSFLSFRWKIATGNS
jgi:hypothetical protein